MTKPESPRDSPAASGGSAESELCVSLTAPLLPCAFPAAEEEAEAGLGAESRSCDELFAEEAVLPSATGTEEEHEA